MEDRDWAEIILFFANLVGKVEALTAMVAQKMQNEAQAIAGVVATAILPRIHFLPPNFPFGELFKPFNSDEDREATEKVMEELIAATKA